MKKFALVASLVALTAIGFSGCSSAEVASGETSEMPVEAGANSAEFNALANSDSAASASAEPSVGAVVDTANPSTTVADNSSYSPPSFANSAPEKSPINLGASSAGRAH
jgi:hypothetical protein